MHNWKFGVVTGLVVVAILAGAKFLPASNTVSNPSIKGETVSNIDKAALAKHLTQMGAKVYGATGCHACTYQKDLFGDSWQYVEYIECSSPSGGQSEACSVAKIEAYPTWEFPNGDKQIGVMTLEELAQKSAFVR